MPVEVSINRCIPPSLFGSRERLYRPGPPAEGGVFALSEGRCTPFKIEGLPLYPWHVGQAVLPGEFPRVTLREVGTGRLTRKVLEHDGQPLLPHHGGTFLDRNTGNECDPTRPPRAGLRCTTSIFQAERFFADAGCTKPLINCYECEGREVMVQQSRQCAEPRAASLHRVGPRHQGLVYETKEDPGGQEICAGPHEPRGPKQQLLPVYTVLDEELLFSRFAPVEERSE